VKKNPLNFFCQEGVGIVKISMYKFFLKYRQNMQKKKEEVVPNGYMLAWSSPLKRNKYIRISQKYVGVESF
jgi:hypothetical protein